MESKEGEEGGRGGGRGKGGEGWREYVAQNHSISL